MRYLMEGTFEDNRMSGKVQIKEAEVSDVKDFIMNGMPEMIQDLFYRLCQNLMEEVTEREVNPDKVLSALSLIALMCQNRISENLTKTLDKFIGDFDLTTEETDQDNNIWNFLSK